MEKNQIKEVIKTRLRNYSKEELVEVLSEICINNTILGRINAMSSQQCVRNNIDTSFAECRQTFNEILKGI